MSNQQNHQVDLPWQPLLVKAAGACCAVGYNLAAASCALRAGMDHFQESEFVDHAGEALKVARLPLGDLWGPKRLAQIARLAVADCARAAGGIDPSRTALILLAAERGRPHTETERYHETFHAIEEECRARFHDTSSIIPKGRASIGDALLHAGKLLREQHVAQVLLVGADSYLNAATIQYYLNKRRLLATNNANGFIPGEAAGALLLGLAQPDSSGLQISGVGRGFEQAGPDNDIPNRAFGLSQAMRQACETANIGLDELEFRIADQNGEQYFAKEAANACVRVMADGNVFLPILTIADCVGETGAAAPVLMTAFLAQLMAREDGPGFTGLMHLANDDGLRSAVLFEQFA